MTAKQKTATRTRQARRAAEASAKPPAKRQTKPPAKRQTKPPAKRQTKPPATVAPVLGPNAAYVLARAVETFEADIADILTEEGAYKPIHEWPPHWRRMVTQLDVAQLYAGEGDGRRAIGLVQKVKFVDRFRALDMIGKHVDVQAFRENVRVTGTVEVHERITRARRGLTIEHDSDE